MKIDGRCHCGAINYEADIDDGQVFICHCEDCQRFSGAPFRVRVLAARDRFRLIRGTPRAYVKIAESGTARSMHFCGDCGTQTHAVEREGDASPVSISGGTVRQKAELRPVVQAWCRSRLPWLSELEEIPRLERQDFRPRPERSSTMPGLDVYFDYRSPFPFLAIDPVAALARRHGVDVRWTPIRLPELSSYRDRPMGHGFPKRNAYVARDLARWAVRRGLTIRPPSLLTTAASTPDSPTLGRDHPMDTERLLRGALVARRRGRFDAYHRAAYETLWSSGVDDALESALARAIEATGESRATFERALESREVAEELARETAAADERGVFGVPTFFVGDEMFWGQDRLDFVEEALAEPDPAVRPAAHPNGATEMRADRA